MNKMQPFFSICIPTYEMNGRGVDYLRFSFDCLKNQTFLDFEVVVSDHSIENEIALLCEEYAKFLSITYFKNTFKRGSSSANINLAILNAKGLWLKILFQDDYLLGNNSLEIAHSALNNNPNKWFACATEHTQDGITLNRAHYPSYHSEIHFGRNTIGAPSNIIYPNDSNPELFDEKLIWFMDVELYKRLELRYGYPMLTNEILVVNRVGIHQVTNTLINDALVKRETRYIRWKNFKRKLFGVKLF